MRPFPAATLALALTALPSLARAVDTWTTPFPGVRRLRRVVTGQSINALLVDLCAPGVSVRVTGPGERTRTVPSYGALVGAQAAVNGGFYNTRDQSMTDGFVLHNGMSWGGNDHNYTAPVAFGDERAEILPHELVQGPQPWMREGVEGHPTLIHDGRARDNSGDTGLCPRNPRTAAGLTADRRTLILAVVDGRSSPTRLGMTCNELATLMGELGARWALNLDGGGSSTMWLAGAGVVNFPSDGSPRTVSNHLAVYARGSGAAPHCPRPAFRAQYVMQTFPLARTTLDLAPGGTFRGYLEMRNTGSATWTPARTRLGTTQPRDRRSPVAGADWLAPNRPAAIDRTVPPGMTGRFNFTVRAPLMPGEYSEYFNLVEEGTAWFSDPGQGGPADNVIQVRVRTVAGSDAGVSPPMDAGARDASVTVDRPVTADVTLPEDAPGADVAESDTPPPDDTVVTDDVAAADDVVVVDDAVTDDAGTDAGADGGMTPEEPMEGGCACSAPGERSASRVRVAWLAALAALVGARRRRRR